MAPQSSGGLFSSYNIVLRSSAGVLLRTLDDWTGVLEYTRSVNAVGVLTINLPRDDALWNQAQKDCIIEVWRKGSDSRARLAMGTVWFVMARQRSLDASGTELITLTCDDLMGLLNRRIVAYASGSTQSDKTAAAETIIKQTVTEQYISRNSLAQYLTVESDAARGPTLSTASSWQNVLSVLQGACQSAAQQGTYMCFDLEVIANLNYLFRIYTGQRGIDRSTKGLAPVTISPESGTMSAATYAEDYHGAPSVALVTGQGDQTAPAAATVTDITLASLGPFAQTEIHVDAQQTTDTAALTCAGDAALRAARPVKEFGQSVEVLQSPSFVYERDFSFGDRLMASIGNTIIPVVMETLDIQVDSKSGKETLTATLRADG
jgi:hypothetical protein